MPPGPWVWHSPSTATGLLRQVLRLPPAIRRSLFTTPEREVYDVVCVGGGPAGLALTSALRSSPSTRRLKVALIDGQDLTAPRPTNDANADQYSNRCSSLTSSSVRFLDEIGAWKDLDRERVQPYHHMEVWDGVSGSKISFDPLDSGGGELLDAIAEMVPGNRFKASRRKYESGAQESVIASMCENGNLTAALLKRLKETEAVEIFDKTKVERIELGPEPQSENVPDFSQWPVVQLSGNRQLAARLLVGADGANSPVRSFADIPSDGWDYNQQGIVATLTLDRSFSSDDTRTAYQRFLPTGPIALLPLPENKASLVWSINTPLANTLKSLPTPEFLSLLNAAFRLEPLDLDFILANVSNLTGDISSEISWRLRHTLPTKTSLPSSFPSITSLQQSSLASFPLRLRHADTYTTHRVALIGDAAHTVHPLAGQGLNLGLADARSLAQRISFAVEHGVDLGTWGCLDEYNSDRWGRNNAVLGVCDKLQKLYSVSSGPVVWARSLGLGIVDRLAWAKRGLMGVAAGGVGR